MLIVNTDTLQPVNLLHFVHEISRESYFTLDIQNILGNSRTTDQRFTGSHIITLIDIDVFSPGNQVFLFLAHIHRFNRDFLFALLGSLGNRHIAVNFAENRYLLGLPDFKKLCNPWKTAGNILGFGRGSR